jgi:ribonuclease HI
MSHTSQLTNAMDIQLHGFSDSTEQAYGACLYLHSTNPSREITCELLCATSKVAPIKKTTLPRLELCGALLLAKLYKKASSALNLQINHVILWTDSSIVLSWINGNGKHSLAVVLPQVKNSQAMQHGDMYLQLPIQLI